METVGWKWVNKLKRLGAEEEYNGYDGSKLEFIQF